MGKKYGGETLFDGNFRLFRNTGKLVDARSLPLENPADESGPEVDISKAALQAAFEKIQADGPRPPVPFSKVESCQKRLIWPHSSQISAALSEIFKISPR